MVILTEKKYKLITIIDDYIKEFGYSPTIRELCKLYDCSSPATMYWHLKELRDYGLIDFQDKKTRTIRIVERKYKKGEKKKCK